MEQTKIALNLKDWKIKTSERSRNRMKLNVKLSKEEGLAFKNFSEMVKPPEISDDDFLKGIFKIGIETMEARLMEAVQKHADDNNINLEEMREAAEKSETVSETEAEATTED
jgi:hypothetical protein|tara:strand:+ start:334 stop:669 length:336 start_codon:yes stop_codon:yes gene_type:complete